jgi:hypothetical protein
MNSIGDIGLISEVSEAWLGKVFPLVAALGTLRLTNRTL